MLLSKVAVLHPQEQVASTSLQRSACGPVTLELITLAPRSSVNLEGVASVKRLHAAAAVKLPTGRAARSLRGLQRSESHGNPHRQDTVDVIGADRIDAAAVVEDAGDLDAYRLPAVLDAGQEIGVQVITAGLVGRAGEGLQQAGMPDQP